MSIILNQVKEIVRDGVKVEVQGMPQYGKYPVVVIDTTDSITSGWELLYRVDQSKFTGKARDSFGHFSELRIKNFNSLYTMIQQVYAQFKQGVNVEVKYDTNFAVYQPNEQLWFTALERKNGTSITITVTDDKSPFHMLQLNFFITLSNQNNQPYMIGYDSCYDANTDVYTEKMNAVMLPKKKRYVPVTKHENGMSTIKAQGGLTPEGLVAINEQNTEIVYLQEAGNERRLLAGLYEKAIIEFVLEKTDEFFASNQENQQQQSTNQQSQPNAFASAFGSGKPFQVNNNQNLAFNQPQNQKQANDFNPWVNADTSSVF